MYIRCTCFVHFCPAKLTLIYNDLIHIIDFDITSLLHFHSSHPRRCRRVLDITTGIGSGICTGRVLSFCGTSHGRYCWGGSLGSCDWLWFWDGGCENLGSTCGEHVKNTSCSQIVLLKIGETGVKNSGLKWEKWWWTNPLWLWPG